MFGDPELLRKERLAPPPTQSFSKQAQAFHILKQNIYFTSAETKSGKVKNNIYFDDVKLH